MCLEGNLHLSISIPVEMGRDIAPTFDVSGGTYAYVYRRKFPLTLKEQP